MASQLRQWSITASESMMSWTRITMTAHSLTTSCMQILTRACRSTSDCFSTLMITGWTWTMSRTRTWMRYSVRWNRCGQSRTRQTGTTRSLLQSLGQKFWCL